MRLRSTFLCLLLAGTVPVGTASSLGIMLPTLSTITLQAEPHDPFFVTPRSVLVSGLAVCSSERADSTSGLILFVARQPHLIGFTASAYPLTGRGYDAGVLRCEGMTVLTMRHLDQSRYDTTLCSHVGSVVFIGPEKQMLGVDAPRTIASVENKQSFGNCPVGNSPRKAMGENWTAGMPTTADDSVAPAVRRSSPDPTIIYAHPNFSRRFIHMTVIGTVAMDRVHLPPKSLNQAVVQFNRQGLGSHVPRRIYAEYICHHI